MHRTAIEGPDGALLEAFDIEHTDRRFERFFARLAAHQEHFGVAVRVAMEGLNGHAHRMDSRILARGYSLFNVSQ